jgi:hypothetical protein
MKVAVDIYELVATRYEVEADNLAEAVGKVLDGDGTETDSNFVETAEDFGLPREGNEELFEALQSHISHVDDHLPGVKSVTEIKEFSWEEQEDGGVLTELNRVVVKVENGTVAEAISPKRASERGIEPDVVFIRNDGWSLGCRYCDEKATEACWAGEWVRKVDVHKGIETLLSGGDNS